MDIKEQFDHISEKYDSQRRVFIPCFDDFYDIAAESVRLECSAPKILDLGAGTGIFSQKVLEKYPSASITLLDLSEKMLEFARARFRNSPNVEICTGDFTSYEIPAGKYDAIVSSLAIHHLQDAEKIGLYKRIYHALSPGGVFVNAEQVLADNPYHEAVYAARWREIVESAGLEKDEIDAAYQRVKLDACSTLGLQLQWLKETGFRYVDCPYKYYDFAVMCAVK